MSSIDMSDLDISKSHNNLLIKVKSDDKIITLKDYFTKTNSGVEKLLTSQGEINLSRDTIKSAQSFWWFGYAKGDKNKDNLISGTNRYNYLKGNNKNDIIIGGNKYDYLSGDSGNDLLIGENGNDRLYGNNDNDTLFGEKGRDFLNGDKGDDTLIGGVGNDTLYGGEGDDTYLFGKGDGRDTIIDKSQNGFFGWFNWFRHNHQKDAGEDTVKFDKEITKDDVSFIYERGDLHIKYGNSDSITVKHQTNSKEKIEKFELSDGEFLTNQDINLIIQQMNAYATDHGMHVRTNDDIRKNQELMNIVSSAWHE
jgi:Ca2+-binding RTX toxin-like protein